MRLIIISNRLPLTITRKESTFTYKETSGGLVTGLKAVKGTLPFLWIGNISGMDLTTEEQQAIKTDCWDIYKSLPVFISKELNELSYNGFCNGIMWPILHTFPDDVAFDHKLYEAYYKFNELFCEAVCNIAQEGDIVWVHDYHLMLLPLMLRKKLSKKIEKFSVGFFLHTPFPPADIFGVLPCASSIVEGILGSDHIGFHTYDYLAHFLDTARSQLGHRITDEAKQVENKIESEREIQKEKVYSMEREHKIEKGKESATQNKKEYKEKCMGKYDATIKKNENHAGKSAGREMFNKNSYGISRSTTSKHDLSLNSSLNLSPDSSHNSTSEDSLRNSVKNCNEESFEDSPSAKITIDGRTVSCRGISIGIDPQLFRTTLASPSSQGRVSQLLQKFSGRKIILGVDRTDYIKGIPNRILGFRNYLQRPGADHTAVFLQICVPSRLDVPEYASLMATINILSAELNSSIGNVDETFMHVLTKSVQFDELCALYAAADVCCISSLMDGMNLVALEYVACQDTRHGVLMLSEFAGCAATLPGAVLFNPWNIEEIADTFEHCIQMSEKERSARHSINSSNVNTFTAVKWAKDNVECLKRL